MNWLSRSFLGSSDNYLIAACPHSVRSQYQEDNRFWKSNTPEVNLKYLYRNINFSGIKNVRDQLLHPKTKTAVCPDGFRFYLEGLTQKMVTLPAVEAPRKNSRFSRK